MKASEYYTNKKTYGVIYDNGYKQIVIFAYGDKKNAEKKANEINDKNTKLKNDAWCFVDEV